jgi:hypothetical protein
MEEKKPVLCQDCKHFRYNLEMAKLHIAPLCSATRGNFLGRGAISWANAASVNVHGECPKYEADETRRPRFWDQFFV